MILITAIDFHICDIISSQYDKFSRHISVSAWVRGRVWTPLLLIPVWWSESSFPRQPIPTDLDSNRLSLQAGLGRLNVRLAHIITRWSGCEKTLTLIICISSGNITAPESSATIILSTPGYFANETGAFMTASIRSGIYSINRIYWMRGTRRLCRNNWKPLSVNRWRLPYYCQPW